MTEPVPMPPLVHKIVGGREVKRLRTKTGRTQSRFGAALRMSQSKIAHIEDGTSLVQEHDENKLLRELNPTGDERQELSAHFALSREQAPKEDLRWRFKAEPMRQHVDLERSAQIVFNRTGTVVPGLLQTEDTVAMVCKAAEPDITPSVLEHRVATRLERQRVLDNLDQRFVFFIDEAAIARLGDSPCRVGQMQRLLDDCDRTNVEMVWFPFSHGYYPGQDQNYWIFSYSETRPDLHIIYLEGHDNSEVLHDGKSVARFLTLRDQQRKAGTDPRDARKWLEFKSGMSRLS